MNKKHSVISIFIGSITLGLTNAWLYTFQGLSFFEAFAGYAVLTFVLMLFLISFVPSAGKYQGHKPARRTRSEKRSRHSRQKTTPSEADDRIAGTVKWYDRQKGYGFLVYEDNEVFFHRNTLRGNRNVKEGDAVRFYVGESEKGPEATEVWMVRK